MYAAHNATPHIPRVIGTLKHVPDAEFHKVEYPDVTLYFADVQENIGTDACPCYVTVKAATNPRLWKKIYRNYEKGQEREWENLRITGETN